MTNSAISDDEVIKRKLIIEGESGNDDRRITLLLKNYLRWVTSDDVGADGFETYQALVNTVYQCENVMEQASLVLTMNQEQERQYSADLKGIEFQMEEAKQRIEACKEELKAAKIIRKNRREYDSLAKVINEHPEREETLVKFTELTKKLEQLRGLNQDYDSRIELRRKQFRLFLFALKDLQAIIDDEEDLPVAGLTTNGSNVDAFPSNRPTKMDSS